jgi:3-hydroxy-3-methylglutaryl CoA synthase/uncharacterized OB-fold protein
LIGIVDYATYVPRYRMQRDVIAAQWCTKSIGGRKAVGNADEDSLTLAYEAAWQLVSRNRAVDALYFASTTSPHWQRASSSFIASACDLPDELDTVDFGGTVQSGMAALRAGLNAVKAGANRRVIITCSDMREAAPESPEEQQFGDAAAAVAVGQEGVIAELVAQSSRTDDFPDEWRRDRDWYVSTVGSRYAIERGYEANVVASGLRAMEVAGVKPGDVTHVALSSPDGRSHRKAALKLGFAATQLVEPPVQDVGVTGTPMPLGLLCSSLDRAKQGEWILVIGHGDGASAFLFRVIGQPSDHRMQLPDDPTIEIPSYAIYRKRRDFTRRSPEEGAIISSVIFEQEERQNVRLHAGRCSACGTVQFPPSRVCMRCHNCDVLQDVAMARRGTVFTFTKDYLYVGPMQPTIMAVIELEDGARFYCQMTDADPEKVTIGMPVLLTLRRLAEGGGMHHYYWKCRPADRQR